MLFGVDGKIKWVKHNCPGSWNDAETSRGLQRKLRDESKTLPEYGIVSDTAFPVSGDLFRKISTPLKEGDIHRFPPEVRPAARAVSNAITSIRQAAEWGMGAVQKPYKRLLLPLPYDKHLRARRLANLFRLYNLRVDRTGISQIRSVFMGGEGGGGGVSELN